MFDLIIVQIQFFQVGQRVEYFRVQMSYHVLTETETLEVVCESRQTQIGKRTNAQVHEFQILME